MNRKYVALPRSTIYHRLCVVMGATRGRFVLAYAADPSAPAHRSGT